MWMDTLDDNASLLFIIDLMTINGKVDSFLTACLVLTFALVVGLGLGHFLGERASFSIQISRNG